MSAPPSTSVFCPQCGLDNEIRSDDLEARCIGCDHPVHPAATARAPAPAPARPFHVRTFGVMAALALVLLVASQALGLTLSMRVLPASESISESALRLDRLVEDGDLDGTDADFVSHDLMRQESLRLDLAAGRLSDVDAVEARSRLRPQDQSLVLGLGGILGVLPPIIAMFLAAVAVASVVRLRRPKEILLGAVVAGTVQLALWLASVEFDLAALGSGETFLLGTGPGFGGPPIMLLGMSTFLSLIAGLGGGHLAWTVADAVGGVVQCTGCEHRYPDAPAKFPACPRCGVKRPAAATVRYSGDDSILGALGASSGGVTLASSGASELLCLRCAKTYAADQCPMHPHEPLLDPREDAVKFQLMDLDAQAGTRRFARWTQDGLGVDADVGQTSARTGPMLCMECARTYDTDRCPVHPDEPMLDPRLEEVRLELANADARSKRRMGGRLMLAAAAVSVAAAVGASTFLETDVVMALFAVVLVLCVGFAGAITSRVAPPRFAQWTGEHADRNELRRWFEDSIVDPLRRTLMHARIHAARIILAILGGAAVGAAIAALLDLSIGGIAFLGGFVTGLGYLAVLAIVGQAREVAEGARTLKREFDDPYGDRD